MFRLESFNQLTGKYLWMKLVLAIYVRVILMILISSVLLSIISLLSTWASKNYRSSKSSMDDWWNLDSLRTPEESWKEMKSLQITRRFVLSCKELRNLSYQQGSLWLLHKRCYENSVNQRRLFNEIKSFLMIYILRWSSILASFFTNKINAIRLEIGNQVGFPYISDANGTVTDSTFSEFNLLSESEVHGLIISPSKKSCPLDPIPTKLVIECLEMLLPPITSQNN